MQSFFDYQSAHERFFVQHGKQMVFKKNHYLVTPNESLPWVFFLAEGIVDASFSFPDGSKRIIGYFLPGMSFAQSGVFFADSGGDLEYEAVTETTVYRLPQAMFLDQLKKDPAFNAEYTTWLLKTQILLIERVVYQGETSLRRKMLRWLLFMAKFYGQPNDSGSSIAVPLTQETIGDFLHVTRESAGKELRQLITENLLIMQHKRITLTNLEALRAELSR